MRLLIIDAPGAEYNAIFNFWKGQVVDPLDPCLLCHKSIRVEKNQSRANAFHRKAVDLGIEQKRGISMHKCFLDGCIVIDGACTEISQLNGNGVAKQRSKAILLRKIILD